MEKNNKIRIVILLGVITAVTSLPLIYPYCINNTNIQLYMERISYAGLMDGFLLVPGLLFRAIHSAESAYKVYVLLINGTSAFVVFWSFYKIFKVQEIALVGSMLYNFSPYRLNSIYIKGDLGEAFALAFVPVLFSALYMLAKNNERDFSKNKIVIMLIVAGSCVLQNDILTFLYLCGTIFLFLIIFWKRYNIKEVLIILAQSIIGILIINFYLIGSLMKILLQSGRSEYFDFSFIQERGVYFLHYIVPYFKYGTDYTFSETGFTNTQPLGVGFAITVCMISYFLIVFLKDPKDKNSDLLKWGNSLAIIGLIYLLLSTNSFPWDILTTIIPKFTAIIYSPTRFIPIVIICFTLVSCILMYKFKNENKEWYQGAMIIIIVLGISLTIYLINDIMTAGEIYTPGLYENSYDLSPFDYMKYMN